MALSNKTQGLKQENNNPKEVNNPTVDNNIAKTNGDAVVETVKSQALGNNNQDKNNVHSQANGVNASGSINETPTAKVENNPIPSEQDSVTPTGKAGGTTTANNNVHTDTPTKQNSVTPTGKAGSTASASNNVHTDNGIDTPTKQDAIATTEMNTGMKDDLKIEIEDKSKNTVNSGTSIPEDENDKKNLGGIIGMKNNPSDVEKYKIELSQEVLNNMNIELNNMTDIEKLRKKASQQFLYFLYAYCDNHMCLGTKENSSIGNYYCLGAVFVSSRDIVIPKIDVEKTTKLGWKASDVTFVTQPANKPFALTKAEIYVLFTREEYITLLGGMCPILDADVNVATGYLKDTLNGNYPKINNYMTLGVRFAEALPKSNGKSSNALPTIYFDGKLGGKAIKTTMLGIYKNSQDKNDDTLKAFFAEKYATYKKNSKPTLRTNNIDADIRKAMAQIVNVTAMKRKLDLFYKENTENSID